MSSFRAWLANAEVGDLIYEEQVVGYEAVAIAKNDWEYRQRRQWWLEVKVTWYLKGLPLHCLLCCQLNWE